MEKDPITGYDHSWKLLSELDPEGICAGAGIVFETGPPRYSVPSFGQNMIVFPNERTVIGSTPVGDFILGRTGHFFDLALLWYLFSVRDIPPTGKLVKPAEIKGGQIFVTGTHVLPLDSIAEKYDSSHDVFIQRGLLLGGELLEYGDASICIYPFPLVPVTIILWKGDEEFPPRSDLFFDESCDQHLPTDVLWSTAMVCVLSMIEDF